MITPQDISISSGVISDLLDEQAIKQKALLMSVFASGVLDLTTLVNGIVYGYVLERTEMFRNTIINAESQVYECESSTINCQESN